ncbi:hypothetical protein SAMN05421678_12363 [Actinopolymorpha cephalotaxi]|uniref:Uncharacterized protein n=1 Tax=Actinopolymorpha cephalotaxi TaxID=504797 RepID=A0A1I3BD36_9ACTN|nr:hypothetical protein [Actinopolymorpha cephalotaxi]SFH60006.1 hypothetical protein SAMN05421678_12363 [Actinopolymorpha cephalotaxi]
MTSIRNALALTGLTVLLVPGLVPAHPCGQRDGRSARGEPTHSRSWKSSNAQYELEKATGTLRTIPHE